MTGDLQDTDAWMNNGMRLVLQVVGAVLQRYLMAEGGDVWLTQHREHGPLMWEFDLWPMVLTMLAAGAIIGAIASRCDGWMTAFAVIALAGWTLGAGVDGADGMAAELMGSGDILACQATGL